MRRSRRMTKALTTAVLVAASFVACDENPVEQSNDPQLTLTADSVVVEVFTAAPPLAVTVRNGNGAIQYDASLNYVSRDLSVATVNANGAISGVAVGSTHVVVTLSERPDVRDSVRVRSVAGALNPGSIHLSRKHFRFFKEDR